MSNSNGNGKILAVFGPDGSGKSTIYKELKLLSEKNNIKVENRHWRPGFFPYKKVFFDETEPELFSTPHSMSPRGRIISFIIAIYIVADFVFGYFFCLRPKLKNGINIYYERYFYDLLIDQKRYRLTLSEGMLRIFASIVIRPDCIVLLEAPTDIIYNRKKEISKEEINRQMLKVRSVFQSSKNVYKLDVLLHDAKACSIQILNVIKKPNE